MIALEELLSDFALMECIYVFIWPINWRNRMKEQMSILVDWSAKNGALIDMEIHF